MGSIDWINFLLNIVANILSAPLLFILGLIFLDRERKLAPWIYRFFGERVATWLYDLVKVIVSPYSRLVLILAALIYINIGDHDLLLSIFISLFSLTLLFPGRKFTSFLPIASISDSFENLNKWKTITGTPLIEDNFGKPAPDLILNHVNGGTNSFITLDKIEKEKGIIECDFYLEDEAIFNIIFFADTERRKWYMARFDSRGNRSDGFIIQDDTHGNWREFRMSGTRTSTKEWHRARLQFDRNKASLFRDGILLVEFDNPEAFGKNIGFFNEVKNVHVDNFSFTEE